MFAPTEAGADQATAEAVLRGEKPIRDLLPPNLLARLLEITDADPLARRASEGILVPVVTVCCRRYAVEDKDRRLTLDCEVETDCGKCLPAAVLEFKAIDKEEPPPGRLARQPMRPMKLSKFLWATEM